MSYQRKRGRSHRTAYAILTLIILFATAVSTALLVPPAWRAIKDPPTIPPPSTPTPTPVVRVPTPERQSICGLWRSDTSQKRYRFICTGEGSFKIEEIDSHGQNNSGSGRFTHDGVVTADLMISEKSRVAHLSLYLSSDGNTISGSWVGDTPEKEFGTLAFHKIQEAS